MTKPTVWKFFKQNGKGLGFLMFVVVIFSMLESIMGTAGSYMISMAVGVIGNGADKAGKLPLVLCLIALGYMFFLLYWPS